MKNVILSGRDPKNADYSHLRCLIRADIPLQIGLYRIAGQIGIPDRRVPNGSSQGWMA